jgi:hypothetical protein
LANNFPQRAIKMLAPISAEPCPFKNVPFRLKLEFGIFEDFRDLIKQK